MSSLLGTLDKDNTLLPENESVFTDNKSVSSLFPDSLSGGLTGNSFQQNTQNTGWHGSLVAPGLSVPNPKRANPIDFLGISDHSMTGMPLYNKTPLLNQQEHYGSSFSHLSTESRSELSAIGVNVSRVRSTDEPTPDIDSLDFSRRQVNWGHPGTPLNYHQSNVPQSPLDSFQQRGLSPKPSASINAYDWRANNEILSNKRVDTLNDSRSWLFPDKPTNLMSRATSSLGISMASNPAPVNLLTRPVSTPAYLNKNNDSLSGLGLGLGFSIQSNGQSSLFDRSPLLDSVIPPLSTTDLPKTYSPFGPDLPQLNLALNSESLNSMPNSLGLPSDPPEESRWPKPVRYGRALDSTENMLGSIIRPPSTSEKRSNGLSPMSNADRLSISPKPTTHESKIISSQPISREITPPPSAHRNSPKLSINNVDDRAIENVIATNCHHILMDAAEHSLKAVELANTLRARVGTEVLGIVRERWGGLLSLLERHPDRFFVERIPKNDRVSLYNSAKAALALQAQQDSITSRVNDSHIDGSDASNPANLNGGEVLDANGLSQVDAQQASRCLHVGNVPSSYTEVQLMREFEKFGQLDGLKLITQKNGNRRFAFVTYKTVAQAITARHCLSKIHPWKSAISFAHRDFSNNPQGQGHGNNTAANNHGSSNKQKSVHSFIQQNNNLHAHPIDMNGLQASGGFDEYPDERQNHHNHHSHSHHNQHAKLQADHSDQQQFKGSELSHSEETNPHSTMSYSSIAARNSNPSKGEMGSHGTHHAPLVGPHPNIENFPDKNALQIILTRLCDDTYVPTQPWPADAVADSPFCQAVIDQVTHFGGSTTISKLRGFLKHRVGTVDNIKSVPLKALLLAYPNFFKVEGNLVSLVTSST